METMERKFRSTKRRKVKLKALMKLIKGGVAEVTATK